MAAWGKELICIECKCIESDVWEKYSTIENEVICGSCLSKRQPVSTRRKISVSAGTTSVESPVLDAVQSGKLSTSTGSLSKAGINKDGSLATDQAKSTRKSSRLKPVRTKSQATVKTQATKGKGRRNIFKKNPIRAPISTASLVTNDYVFYKGSYWQVGDVVSLLDHDGGIYYAQLRGFLQDRYNEKSAVITWLLPTTSSHATEFDSNTYMQGPEEETPRSMDCLEFVCHAPSNHFRFNNQPHPTETGKPEAGFIWSRVGVYKSS